MKFVEKEKAGAQKPKALFGHRFKEALKYGVVLPLVFVAGFFSYLGATGTFKQFKDGSGVYEISVSGNKAKIVLPSFLEAGENYGKMKKVCGEAINSFDLGNPRVVKTLEDVYVVIPSEKDKGKVDELHDSKEGKIFIYNTSDQKAMRHGFIHRFLFKNASGEEEDRIYNAINNVYRIFPEKFGKYFGEAYANEKEDIVRTLDRIKTEFGLSESEMADVVSVLKVWLATYALAEKHGSVGKGELNYTTMTEILAHFSEDKIPEPLVPAYVGVLNEKALKNVFPLPKETIENARRVFKAKIEPHL